jgi:uncharacterized protein (DUF433 family)
MATYVSQHNRTGVFFLWRESMIGELDRVTFDPAVMGGRACIRGLRITVALILNLVANGMSTAEILDAYPYLEAEDIRQALRYAAILAEDRIFTPELAAG